jgi:putative flippase GtrA
MIITNAKERTRFFRFAVVGGIGAIVDFGILNLLLLASFPYVAAGSISFIAAVANNFIWNRYWTYPDSRSKSVARQVAQFVIINALGLAIRAPLLAWLEDILIDLAKRHLSLNTLSPEFVGHNTGLAIAIVIVMFWNFLANRYWTYNDVSS